MNARKVILELCANMKIHVTWIVVAMVYLMAPSQKTTVDAHVLPCIKALAVRRKFHVQMSVTAVAQCLAR